MAASQSFLAYREQRFSRDYRIAAQGCPAKKPLVAIHFARISVKIAVVGTAIVRQDVLPAEARTYKAEPTVAFRLAKATNDAIKARGCIDIWIKEKAGIKPASVFPHPSMIRGVNVLVR